MATTSPSCSTKPSPHWRFSRAAPTSTRRSAAAATRADPRRLGPAGRLVALDRDPAAEAAAPRSPIRAFASAALVLGASARGRGARHRRVDGVLLDLGISSPQIDDPARGFSLRADGPLDMRMDPTRGESAAAFLARADVRELTEVIRDYGEERFAQSIARAIVAARAVAPIVRTRQLAAIVAQAVGARPRGDWSQDPATRTFQALRIFVNRELAELALTLPRAVRAARSRRTARGDQLPLARGPDREALLRAASQPFGGDPRLARLPLAEAALPRAPLALVGRAIRPARPRSRRIRARAARRCASPSAPRTRCPRASAPYGDG